MFFCLTDVNPASVQAFHGDAEALSFLAEPVAHRNSTVLKDHRPGGLRVPTHLQEDHRCEAVALYRHLVVAIEHCRQVNVNQYEVNLLLFLAEAEARCSLLDHHAGDAFRSFPSRPHHDNVHVRVSPAADEGLKKSNPILGPRPSMV